MAKTYVYVFEQTRHIAVEASSENEARAKLHTNAHLAAYDSKEKIIGKLDREKEND